MRRAAKVDANQGVILDALLRLGCNVQSLAGIGCGCPDLLVARGGHLWLIEIKDGDKPPSERQLTPDQKRWHARWTGSPVYVVTSAEEAVLLIVGRGAKAA